MDTDVSLTDVWLRLREIDHKLDRVRGHVNVLSTINKRRDLENLYATCTDKIGRSLDMQRLWYYAQKPQSVRKLAKQAGIDEKKARVYLDRLHERGMLDKNELSDPVTYVRDEITEGIGLERWVRDNHTSQEEKL